ncbi:ABC transporter family protein [Ehrlichia chaffeensis str. Heartland]|uniref:Zinc import ATP-binding protein ZnuC n=1 Tax=Ehrlichia chaffeensis (strain ATCC CRL-10679 / Arkansas) TaxID=205920 RepID=ZNUC_EHRCR|nr:metal ABC transporter ATP-binding protein [Ehrlichia chaffeensis]Q2GFZ6.1 RecName: Full=Zinc import ATP-binding protein ZnuC [Ehrlichia chaffeensis str. Arkansas]ABD45148.1 putative cation ABC transporter, ATP-binding protein [Ehrlichia chaffeensis str. Arkansas]AHX03891.1 ABC transporter family protein [Ehrlichia chaffeensis str. Heartland]AHX05383.1 ABC transporter family protein [Ehrlichia chaffeensis str. Jax]AHX06369.1 ABC transporter family protein [Ehrlichia chaffeensis str. Liberty]
MFHKLLNKSEILAYDKKYVNNYIINVENLSFFYSKEKVIDDISFQVKFGEIVTILGPNGGGKTTLIRILVGIYRNYIGVIKYAKNFIIGYLPQHFSVNSLIPMTVKYFLNSSYTKSKRKLKLSDVLKDINIEKILDRQMSEISHGELQLVLLARCLMLNPDIIILDEPVSCMDVNAKDSFYKLINKLISIYNLSVIMTSHDLHFVMSNSYRVICINRSIYCEGSPSEIVKNEKFLKMFSSYA